MKRYLFDKGDAVIVKDEGKGIVEDILQKDYTVYYDIKLNENNELVRKTKNFLMLDFGQE